jgi:hypothetical protein
MSSSEYLLTIIFAIYTPIFFLVFLSLLDYSKYYLKYKTERILLILYILSLSLIFSLRPLALGMDTQNYFDLYFYQYSTPDFKLSSELLFHLLARVSQIMGGFEVFLFLISFISMYSLYYFSRRVLEGDKFHSISFILFFMISGISFIPMQINTLKVGLAISIMLVGLHYLLKNKMKFFYLISIIAFLIHNSIIVMIVSGVLVHYIKSPLRVYFSGYLIVIALSYFQVIKIYNIQFLGDFLLYYQGYYAGNYKVGFRLDFVLYNTIWLLFAYVFQKKLNITDFWLKIYIVLSCIFFLSFEMPYSDRIGMFSWVVAPIMLATSFNVLKNPYKSLKWPFLAIFSIINLYLAL